MANESFFGLTSLLRPKKEVLWIGSENEAPSQSLSPLLSKIKFVTFNNADKSLSKSDFQVLVVSVTASTKEINEDWADKILKVKARDKLLLINSKSDEVLPWPLIRVLNLDIFNRVLFLPIDEAKLGSSLLAALEAYKSATNTENDNEVKIASTKVETEKKITRMRGLVRYVKGLTEVVSAQDIMRTLRDEIKNFSRIKEPILAYANNLNQLQLMFYQGTQIVEKVIPGAWPQQLRIRLNDVKDSQFLANIFGRPFGKLLTIPLNLKRKSQQESLKVSAVLFFEHSLNEAEMKDFLNFIEDRLQPMSITLDRMLLEHDLKEASLLWERTFDGLHDPIVIFDSQNQIIRANKSFNENLSDAPADLLQESSLVHKDKFYHTHSYPIQFGEAGTATHNIKHFIDVTLPHKLQKQMIQNEKMAALGHLAGHIAHELNNPLTGVRSLAQVLLQQKWDSENAHNDLVEVEKAAQRCQLIIKNLLEFSSGGLENQKQIVSMNEIVQKTLPLLKTLISKYDIQIHLTEEKNSVAVEPHLMQQVVFNIINNAAQAMGDSGRLEIRTEIVHEGNAAVALSVTDSGAGISPEIKNQIFDFFFTTKSQGQGTGLGLSISKNIVDSFSGRIDVKSEIGKGSTFTIILPLREQNT